MQIVVIGMAAIALIVLSIGIVSGQNEQTRNDPPIGY